VQETPSGNDLQLCFHSGRHSRSSHWNTIQIEGNALWVAYRLTKTFGADQGREPAGDMMGGYYRGQDVPGVL
jgi:hypothetical protein